MTKQEYEEFYSVDAIKARILKSIESHKNIPEGSKVTTVIFKMTCEYNDEGYDVYDPIVIIITSDKQDYTIDGRKFIPSYEEQEEYSELTNYRADLLYLIPNQIVIHL